MTVYHIVCHQNIVSQHKGGSGLYPYPNRAENEIPLEWGSGLYPYLDWAENEWYDGTFGFLHNKSDRGFAKGKKMGSLKFEKGLILGVSLLRLKSAFELPFARKWLVVRPRTEMGLSMVGQWGHREVCKSESSHSQRREGIKSLSGI